MLGIKVRTVNQMARLKRSVAKASAGNVFSAAGLVMKSAKHSIERSPEASEPGQPPHTRRRQLPNAIVFHADKDKLNAVIGPRHSRVGEAGAPHEHGGEFMGDEFAQRPFMVPALERVAPVFAGSFKGSIGE